MPQSDAASAWLGTLQRQRVMKALALLSSGEDQLDYDMPDEIVETISETFLPKSEAFIAAFSHEELERLAEYFGLARYAARQFECHTSVEEMLKVPEWRAAMRLAASLLVQLRRPGPDGPS